MPELSTFDSQDPNYNAYQAAALAKVNDSIMAKANQSKMLADFLGPQTSSGAFGNLPPEALLGMMPNQVDEVAKTRSAAALSQVMTNMHALDFANKISGQSQQDELNSLQVKEGNAKDVEAMKADAEIAKAKASNKILAAQMKFDTLKAEIGRKIAAGTATPSEHVVFGSYEKLTEPISTYTNMIVHEKELKAAMGGDANLLLAFDKAKRTQKGVAELNAKMLGVKLDDITGEAKTPTIKLPETIKSTSAAIEHLTKKEGMSKEQAIQWIKDNN